MKKDEEREIISVENEKDKSKKYLNLFEKAKTFNSGRQEAYAENMAFYQGNQHLLNKYKQKTPWVVNMNTPYATVAIDNRVASLLSNDYIGELLPLSEEDVESIDALQKVYKKEWERMNLDQLVRESIRTSAVVRESYVHITLNPNKIIGGNGNKILGCLEAYNIDPSQIFIDPTARKFNDARYIFVTGRISREEAEKEYPKLKALNEQGDLYTPQDRGEIYYDNDYDTEQDDVYTVLNYYGKTKEGIERVKIINGVLVYQKIMKGLTTIPVAQMRWKKAAQSCYGLSLMDEVLALQKAITSIESAITNTALAYAAPSMMVRKGCGLDPKVVAKSNGAPGVVYAVDGDLSNAMKPVVVPKIEESILNIKSDYQIQIDKITGNSQQFLGDIGTAGNTSSGAKMAVDRAKIIEIDILKNIAEFVEDLTNITLNYLKLIYPGEKLNTYDGKDESGKHKFMQVEVPETSKLDNLQYKYYIELETKTPFSKERQKELLLEIYQLERQYDTPIKTITLSDIIKNSDLENKDEIIARFNNLTFQDATTKAETIEQMYAFGVETGVDQALLTDAIAEIISNQKETPAVDEVMSMMEQSFQQEIQKQQMEVDGTLDQLMNTPQMQQEIEQGAIGIEQGQMNPQNMMEMSA